MNIKLFFLNVWTWLTGIPRDGGSFRFNYGILKDKKDKRDYSIKEKIGTYALASEIKAYSLDIKPFTYVKNQGQWNSCASHTMATAIEIMNDLKKTNKRVPLSERHHYYYGRQPEYRGNFPANGGMTSRDMLKVAQRIGLTPEKLCPYISSKMNDKPGQWAEGFAESGWWKIKHYFRVSSVSEAKEALLNNLPVLIGIYCTASFKASSTTPPISSEGKRYGGHEIVIIGYDDNIEGFKIINSWGGLWKDRGTAWLPYEYIEKHLIDMWTFTIYE